MIISSIKGYFDGSGKSNDVNPKFITLAGYVGTSEAWKAFDHNWVETLRKHNLDYLHMKEVLRNFPFKKNVQLPEIISEVFNNCFSEIGWGLYKGQFFGTWCTVNLEHYNKLSLEIPDCANKEPEAICVDHAITTVFNLLQEPTLQNIATRAELYFDQKERFMHMVDRVWRSKKRSQLQGPLKYVSAIGQCEMSSTMGLQAADFLAWLTNYSFSCETKGWRKQQIDLLRILACPTQGCYCDYTYLNSLKDQGYFPKEKWNYQRKKGKVTNE